jgi:hypothetical protein
MPIAEARQPCNIWMTGKNAVENRRATSASAENDDWLMDRSLH